MKMRRIIIVAIVGVGLLVTIPYLYLRARATQLFPSESVRAFTYEQVAADRLRNPNSIKNPYGSTYVPGNVPPPTFIPIQANPVQANPSVSGRPARLPSQAVANNPNQPSLYLTPPYSNNQLQYADGSEVSSNPAVLNLSSSSLTLDNPAASAASSRAIDGKQWNLISKIRSELSAENKKHFAAELRKLVSEEFDAKMDVRAARIDSLQKEIADAKRIMESRRSRRDEIIDRRIAELTGAQDEFAWDSINRNVSDATQLNVQDSVSTTPSPLFADERDGNASGREAYRDDSQQSDRVDRENGLKDPQIKSETTKTNMVLEDEPVTNDLVEENAWAVNGSALSVIQSFKAFNLKLLEKTGENVEQSQREWQGLSAFADKVNQSLEDAKIRTSLRREEIAAKIRAKESELKNAEGIQELNHEKARMGLLPTSEVLESDRAVIQLKSAMEIYQQRLRSFDSCLTIMQARAKTIEDETNALRERFESARGAELNQ